MADEQIHQADELGHEEDERKDNEAEKRMTKNFADDVTVQNAHGANGECSTAVDLGPGGRAQ